MFSPAVGSFSGPGEGLRRCPVEGRVPLGLALNSEEFWRGSSSGELWELVGRLPLSRMEESLQGSAREELKRRGEVV